MTYLEFCADNLDDFGDPIPMTVRDTQGNLLADFDMDRYTYAVEGIDEEQLEEREVISVEDHGTYKELIVK